MRRFFLISTSEEIEKVKSIHWQRKSIFPVDSIGKMVDNYLNELFENAEETQNIYPKRSPKAYEGCIRGLPYSNALGFKTALKMDLLCLLTLTCDYWSINLRQDIILMQDIVTNCKEINRTKWKVNPEIHTVGNDIKSVPFLIEIKKNILNNPDIWGTKRGNIAPQDIMQIGYNKLSSEEKYLYLYMTGLPITLQIFERGLDGTGKYQIEPSVENALIDLISRIPGIYTREFYIERYYEKSRNLHMDCKTLDEENDSYDCSDVFSVYEEMNKKRYPTEAEVITSTLYQIYWEFISTLMLREDSIKEILMEALAEYENSSDKDYKNRLYSALVEERLIKQGMSLKASCGAISNQNTFDSILLKIKSEYDVEKQSFWISNRWIDIEEKVKRYSVGDPRNMDNKCLISLQTRIMNKILLGQSLQTGMMSTLF